jgi:hypothetical protein
MLDDLDQEICEYRRLCELEETEELELEAASA